MAVAVDGVTSIAEFQWSVFALHSRPVKHDADKQRIIREAAAMMGHRELAGRLGVSMGDVSSWMDGTATVPDSMLIVLSEMLLSWSGKQRFK